MLPTQAEQSKLEQSKPDYFIPEESQLVKVESFRIGVAAFFDVEEWKSYEEGHQTIWRTEKDEDGYGTTLQQIIEKLPSFNSYGEKVEVTIDSQFIEPSSESSPVRGISPNPQWLLWEEERVAEKHDGIMVACYEGVNSSNEPAYFYVSIRFERLNRAFAVARRGEMYAFPFGRVIKCGTGHRDNDIIEEMFDGWLFQDDRIVVKLIKRKAGAES